MSLVSESNNFPKSNIRIRSHIVNKEKKSSLQLIIYSKINSYFWKKKLSLFILFYCFKLLKKLNRIIYDLNILDRIKSVHGSPRECNSQCSHIQTKFRGVFQTMMSVVSGASSQRIMQEN